MIGGSTNNSTKSGANFTIGSPGTRARATPLTTKRIAGGIFSRSAATETAAMTVRSKIRICTVIMDEPTVHPSSAMVGEQIPTCMCDRRQSHDQKPASAIPFVDFSYEENSPPLTKI